MGQAIYNDIISNILSIEDNLGLRSHFSMGGQTHSVNPQRQ